MKFRFYLALWTAKLSVIALKITKHKGTNFPGIVAQKICPDFIKYAKKPEKIIAITGTNGKTTCANMVLDMLTKDGYNVLNNKYGSNISTGINTSLINGMTFFGKEKNKIAVFEIDERSARRIFPYLKPDYMLVTNLSRDSIMRNAHPEYIRDFISEYMPKNTKLILNADDLISSAIAKNNERVYFGIEKMDGDLDKSINLINDIQICPNCHSKLSYKYVRYNHIGRAYCKSCNFCAPEYDYSGYDVDTKNMTIKVKDKEGSYSYTLLNDSVFNIYNVVSVVALMRELGYTPERVSELLSMIGITKSRFNEIKIKDKTLFKLLAKEKNAFATTRVFDYISKMPGDKEILVMNSCQNDIKHWSENTCWLYDCDFEFLNDDSIKNIIVCGPRRFDHKLRLLLAGVNEDRITLVENEKDTPNALKLFDNDNIYVLYGTDSLVLGLKTAKKVENILRTL